MKKIDKLIKNISIVLGFISSSFIIFNLYVYSMLRPKMVNFYPVSSAEEGLINWIGVGLLSFLIFCLFSLYRLAVYLKKAKKVTRLSLFLLGIGVVSLLMIFGDVALLSDIGKQYKHGLSQPEWLILYPVTLFQLFTAIVFTWFHISGFSEKEQEKYVVRDSNIFMTVQYVGVICGLTGFSLSSLGFRFPRAWSLQIHTTMSSIILLVPYALVVSYWILVKLHEKNRLMFDEKQLQDVGKSAFLTMLISVVFMTGLFIINYNNLRGVVSIIWLPLYLFLVLFLFFCWKSVLQRKRVGKILHKVSSYAGLAGNRIAELF